MKFGIKSLLTLLASLVAVGGLTTRDPARAQNASHAGIDRVVAFGTSLTDTGNAFIWLSEPANQNCGTRLNVPPYDALDDLLVPDGPYAKGGHHFTNGATWVEGLARYLALAGNVRPALQNTGMKASNYATGGARAVANYPCRFNLPAQVNTYLADFPQTSARTLVVIEIGSNDLRDALIAAASGQDPTPYIANALGSLTTSIIQLYGYGAKRFLVVNVPDIGKTPAVRTLDLLFPGIAGLANTLSQIYNAKLALAVQGLVGAGIDVRILDIYTTLNTVVADPGKYGFLNATDACITPNQPPFSCAQPDTYVFWDGIHPTKALHAIVAQQAIAVISAP
jgi:phospholipase/lecithinase/hemolysin